MVVVAGFTVRDPEEETLPTPLSIVTDVALETDQFKTAEPASMLEGLIAKLLMVGPFIVGVDPSPKYNFHGPT